MELILLYPLQNVYLFIVYKPITGIAKVFDHRVIIYKLQREKLIRPML